ncbi:Putative coatomer subunit alpha [Frankliniella fusca]|uniref:Coatomer subunit alpha n=1 Tax=Frankliniella fusca TaxID=407009 RepID=A0AAE1GUD5_9NEOP|nr:Putative coatomer subunit alpha [Frankliniella fusca]
MASKVALATLAVALLVALAAANHKVLHTKSISSLDLARLQAKGTNKDAVGAIGITVNSGPKKVTRSVNKHRGIQSYDVIKVARPARSVTAVGSPSKVSLDWMPPPSVSMNTPASRPKRFFGFHRHRHHKVVVVHQQLPTLVQPPAQIVYIHKQHRHHHHRHHQHRPIFSVHLG